MPVFLLKIVFLIISYFSYFASRFILSGTAHLLVLLINAFKIPGQSAKGLMQQVAEAIKGLVEYGLSFAAEAIATAISTSFGLIKDGAVGSASGLGPALAGLLEQTRGSLEGLFKDVPELIEGFNEMVSTIVTDLFNNYKEALAYLTENA